MLRARGRYDDFAVAVHKPTSCGNPAPIPEIADATPRLREILGAGPQTRRNAFCSAPTLGKKPASSLRPQPSSRLLVYSRRQHGIAEETGTTVGVAVSAETPLTAMGAGDQPATACQQPPSEAISVPDKMMVAAGVEASTENPLTATSTTPTIAAGVEASAETPLAAANTSPTIAAVVDDSPETPLAAAHTDDLPSTSTIHKVPASTGVVVPRVTPPVIEIPPPSREAFIARIARQTVSILAVPSTVKRCTKANSAGPTPRRSRRLAGV
jgi:hypothetical protein